MELPIFDQGQGAIAKLAAQYRQAERKLQNQAIAIRSEVRQAVEDLKMDRDLTLYYKKVVMPLNVQVANQSLLQFNAMQKNAFDLLQAKQNELCAERDYVEAWRDYWDRPCPARRSCRRTSSRLFNLPTQIEICP